MRVILCSYVKTLSNVNVFSVHDCMHPSLNCCVMSCVVCMIHVALELMVYYNEYKIIVNNKDTMYTVQANGYNLLIYFKVFIIINS